MDIENWSNIIKMNVVHDVVRKILSNKIFYNYNSLKVRLYDRPKNYNNRKFSYDIQHKLSNSKNKNIYNDK